MVCDIAKRGNRYPKEVIERCREEYLSGKGSMKEVAERNGVNVLTLAYYSDKEGSWSRLRDERERNRTIGLVGSGTKPTSIEPTIVSEQVLAPEQYQERVRRYRSFADELEDEIRDTRRMLKEDDLTPSERVQLKRALVPMLQEWREMIGVARLKPIDTQGRMKNVSEIPLDVSPT